MEEEIKARIAGGEKGRGHILREAHGGQAVIGLVEVGDHCIDEGVSRGG